MSDAMSDHPTLRTERLILRAFTEEDAPRLAELAGAREIADTTLSVPHPYKLEDATSWIAWQPSSWVNRWRVDFAITEGASGELVGTIGQGINADMAHGELGYWVGVPYWNRGYCTEAARAVVAYAFTELSLHRVYAHHLIRNPASGRVMQKIGMRQEGVLRGAVKKWDVFEDLALYAILADDCRDLLGG